MEIRTEDDVTIAVMVPRFDAYTANDVDMVLRELIAKGTKKIVCDFSQTEYVASAGLRVLLSSAKNLQKTDGQILLVSMKPYVYEVFEISGFTQIFKIFPSQKEALQSLNQP
ncbi:MAG: STAS domain-containing protein [Candidatus Bathyarchaeota archaeon]|nr:STAS domain-containing protein [Candidatus Bathyarchaeota archaeon]